MHACVQESIRCQRSSIVVTPSRIYDDAPMNKEPTCKFDTMRQQSKRNTRQQSKRNRFLDSSLVEEKKDEQYDKDPSSPLNEQDKGSQTISVVGSRSTINETAKHPKHNFLVAFIQLILHAALLVLFFGLAAAVCLHKINDDYLYPQLKLMRWIADGRDFDELTYYHRICDGSDVTATSVNDLIISTNATNQEATRHMLKHGASLYQNLLTPETASELREFIDKENKRQKGWFVIENENRYSWGIDMNMHPAFQTYWKELASNEQLVKALQSTIGPDPAVIEFTAITSSYGALDQHDHQDVVPPGSAAKFARSFIPSYSLFIPLQDTTYDMGATHVCPGTHLCSEGCEEHCPAHNLAMSGDGIWPRGWGALVNQQTTHKGMGHFCKGCPDRIVLIATFAPRPQTQRKLETRMIGQGGSYSLKWNQWGNTFSDFVHADKRMTEIQKYLRSLGIIKGNGWSWVSVVSMRISNFEYGYNNAEDFIEDGGFWFLPKAWQALDTKRRKNENLWYTFLFESLKRVEANLLKLNAIAIGIYAALALLIDIYQSRTRSTPRKGSLLLRGIVFLVVTHGMVCVTAWLLLGVVAQSNWARDIRNAKAYRLPISEDKPGMDLLPMTIPLKTDILITSAYAADELALYSLVVDVAHPGNRIWNELVLEHANSYSDLSQSLQLHLCQSMIAWMLPDRRFLTLNEFRQWQPITDGTVLAQFCQREIKSASNELQKVMLRQVDSLKDDTQNGRWRDMGIHKTTMYQYLEQWEKRFISLDSSSTKKTISNSKVLPKLRYAQKPESTVSPCMTRKSALQELPATKEPFPGAWLQVGDIVESRYECQNDDWYRGKIIDALSNDGTYSVQYDDGDTDDALLPQCIRRFVDYTINEAVEVNPAESGIWLAGEILNVHDDGYFDIQVPTGTLYHRQPHSALRRPSKTDSVRTLDIGTQILARFNEGDEYFPGVIVEDNGDGTFNVEYDDGDFEVSVKARMIKFRNS